MMINRPFGAHWLAYLGLTKTGDGHLLRDAAASASTHGASIFELACRPVNDMSAMETAKALDDAEMETASYCRFFPGDGSYGDPLADDNALALETIRQDLGFIDILDTQGIAVTYITGPSCFVLGKLYDEPKPKLLDRAYEWYRKVGELMGNRELTVCIEYLRPSEDKSVLGSMDVLCGLIDRLKDPRFRVHGDIFHMLERGEDPHDTILKAGKRLAYLHAHGTKRQPPGWYNRADMDSADRVNWHLVSNALNAIDFKGPVVPEPFGPAIRLAIPALGEGLPEAIDANQYYELAWVHLDRHNII